jgi:hypothetical protein
MSQLLEVVGRGAKRTKRIIDQLGEEGFLVRDGDLVWISPGQRPDQEDP